jgi:DNA-binding IclR family transcriptional regulator
MPRPSPQTERVVALIEMLAEHPLTLAEVTRRLGVNKSSCYSMLAALTTAGWLLRDPARKTYRLGPALVNVARSAERSFPALEFSRPAAVELSHELGLHVVTLEVRDGSVTVVDQIRDVRAGGAPLRFGEIPLQPPFGSAVIAWSAAPVVEGWLGAAPVASRGAYREALGAIRKRGYAVELSVAPEERLRDAARRLDRTDGLALPQLVERLAHDLATRDDFLPATIRRTARYTVSAINAPVFDHTGAPVLVLSLLGFTATLTGADVEGIGARLAGVTRGVTAALAGPGPGARAASGSRR